LAAPFRTVVDSFVPCSFLPTAISPTHQKQELQMAEMQAPQKIEPKTAGDYLEVMSKAIFQSGMSWRVVESKWPGTRDAFHGFAAEKVAAMSDRDVDRLAADPRVIRNRRKIEAIRENAVRLLERAQEHGSVRAYLRAHGDFEDTVSALRKDFKFLGDLGAYYLLYVVGEQVPSHEEWCRSRERGRR
jgi:3-methyladenine DNA glycosylase Tag